MLALSMLKWDRGNCFQQLVNLCGNLLLVLHGVYSYCWENKQSQKHKGHITKSDGSKISNGLLL